MQRLYDIYHTDSSVFLSLLGETGPLSQYSRTLGCSQQSVFAKQLLFESVSEYEDALAALRDGDDGRHSWGVIPHAKEFKVAFFDMDGTVTEKESMVEVGRRFLGADLKKEVEDLTKQAMDGEIDFALYLQKKMRSFQGVEKSVVQEVQASLKLHRGAKELIDGFGKALIPSYLVTAGLESTAIPLVLELGMMGLTANRAQWQEETLAGGKSSYVFTGELKEPIIDAAAKADYVTKQCAKLECSLDEAMVFGDGANDEKMAAMAGLAMGFEPKLSLVNSLQVVNRTRDHMFFWDLLKASRCL